MIERLPVRIPTGAAGEQSSPELTLCANPNSVSVPPTCYRSGLTMPLPRHRVGTYPERAHTQLVREHSATTSQLAEPLWTDPDIKSGISVRDLIFKKKKKAGGD